MGPPPPHPTHTGPGTHVLHARPRVGVVWVLHGSYNRRIRAILVARLIAPPQQEDAALWLPGADAPPPRRSRRGPPVALHAEPQRGMHQAGCDGDG